VTVSDGVASEGGKKGGRRGGRKKTSKEKKERGRGRKKSTLLKFGGVRSFQKGRRKGREEQKKM